MGYSIAYERDYGRYLLAFSFGDRDQTPGDYNVTFGALQGEVPAFWTNFVGQTESTG
jgi:hypothetical protein